VQLKVRAAQPAILLDMPEQCILVFQLFGRRDVQKIDLVFGKMI